MDFIRGAAFSRGGRSIIALPATASGGNISRICTGLAPGQAVTTSRNDIDFVVTEYGIAALRGKTVLERAKALIGIAAPQYREQLRKEDVLRILEKILYEFPVRQIEYYIPKWVELLPVTHYLKEDLLKQMKEKMGTMEYIRDIRQENLEMDSNYVKSVTLEEINLSNGVVKVRIQIEDPYYYQVMSEMTGVTIESEYQLIHTLKELAQMKQEYTKVQQAIESVRGTGYGVVIPEKNEITLEEPVVIRQGNKYGVKIKSVSPSIHMIKANIETEIAPIVGSEEQAHDLITFIKENEKNTDDGMWETNIFGKSIEQLVEDGIRTKIAQISEESQVKLQDTMQKIVNDSKGGLICIII